MTNSGSDIAEVVAAIEAALSSRAIVPFEHQVWTIEQCMGYLQCGRTTFDAIKAVPGFPKPVDRVPLCKGNRIQRLTPRYFAAEIVQYLREHQGCS